eukprot:9298529-Alexandrium_andersonii.AAC.1
MPTARGPMFAALALALPGPQGARQAASSCRAAGTSAAAPSASGSRAPASMLTKGIRRRLLRRRPALLEPGPALH